MLDRRDCGSIDVLRFDEVNDRSISKIEPDTIDSETTRPQPAFQANYFLVPIRKLARIGRMNIDMIKGNELHKSHRGLDAAINLDPPNDLGIPLALEFVHVSFAPPVKTLSRFHTELSAGKQQTNGCFIRGGDI